MFATPAHAQTAASGAAGGSPLTDMLAGPLPLIAIFGVLFFFMILRPQQKRAKQHQTTLASLKRGDTVVLSSGMIGKVNRVEEAEVVVDIAPNVPVRVVKTTITEVRGKPDAANDVKS